MSFAYFSGVRLLLTGFLPLNKYYLLGSCHKIGNYVAWTLLPQLSGDGIWKYLRFTVHHSLLLNEKQSIDIKFFGLGRELCIFMSYISAYNDSI